MKADNNNMSEVTLTPSAATKAAELVDRENNADLFLRIAVQPGGCSGLRYQLFFDDRDLDGDERWTFETEPRDIDVVVDRMSAPYLSGAVIDFVDEIDKQGFTIDNPNASGSCACGDSFH
jgi:iron-sulfur cluster assembly accessory protein